MDDYERRIAELREQQAQVLDEYVAFVKEQQGKLDEASKAFNENLSKLEQQFDDGEITEAAYQRQRRYYEMGLQRIESASRLLK